MKDEQSKRFDSIMDCAKEGCHDELNALLAESSRKKEAGEFSEEYSTYFHKKIRSLTIDEKIKALHFTMQRLDS